MNKAMDQVNALSWYDKWMRAAAFDAYWRIIASEVYEYEAVEIMRWIDELECLTYAPEMEEDMKKAVLDSQSVLVRTQYSDDCDKMLAYLDILYIMINKREYKD